MRDDDEESDESKESEKDSNDSSDLDSEILNDKIRRADADSRMVYNDNTTTLDMRKRKATYVSQNSKVFLPPPLNPIIEAGLSTGDDGNLF